MFNAASLLDDPSKPLESHCKRSTVLYADAYRPFVTHATGGAVGQRRVRHVRATRSKQWQPSRCQATVDEILKRDVPAKRIW